MAESRIIKKYPNRRLYDTELSRYITLADVRELVTQGADFKVIDANTNEDLTRNILLQIIIDKETGSDHLFTTEILSKMIRFYGDSVQGVFSDYLEKSLGLFVEQQTRIQQQLGNLMTKNPMDAMTDLTKRNLEIWRDMQDNFLKVAGVQPNSREPDNEKKQDDQ